MHEAAARNLQQHFREDLAGRSMAAVVPAFVRAVWQ
jgi:hypothetical protein